MQSSRATLLEHIFTIPEAQIKLFDLKWQSTFYTVFHQTKISKLIHTISLAPIVFSLYVLASYINFGDFSIAYSLPTLTAVNGALIVLAISAFWYLAMDFTVGLVTLPIIVSFCLLANAFNGLFGMDGIYVASGMVVFFSLIQTISHQPEPVPPPHSGTDKFMAYKKWTKTASFWMKAKVVLLFPVFTFVELISSPRLLPVQILRLMHRFGYKKELEQETVALAKRVLKSGDYNAYFSS